MVEVQLKFITERLLIIRLTLESYNCKDIFLKNYLLLAKGQISSSSENFRFVIAVPFLLNQNKSTFSYNIQTTRLQTYILIGLYTCVLFHILSLSVTYINTYIFEIEEKLLVIFRELSRL